MNTAQIKAYAPKARTDFIKAVTERAARFGIHSDNLIDPIEFKGDLAIIGNQAFSKKGGELREKLAGQVKQLGFEMFIRSSAYTWFNRFVAIRYMELHDFLGHGFKVLSNPNGSDIPEILEHATDVDLPGLDKEKVIELRLAGDKDNELYRMLIIAQCNALHKAMPFLFEKIDNEAELLLPDNLLHSNSPVRKMVQEIDEDLWKDVEIIGWIYQFYISEKKDEVIGKVVKSEDIPAATQLFTPNWIVKYMVQNTLGHMWMATYPHSSLKDRMEYYIEPAEQDPEVQKEIDAITPKELNPEKITFLDPACGSGHILVEAYDILKDIYLERGYRTRDIPRLILEKNLYGLDIDDRAAQLACFAILMKAREDDRSILAQGNLSLNVISIQESVSTYALHIDNFFSGDEYIEVRSVMKELLDLFENGKTFGSLISISKKLIDKIAKVKEVVDKKLSTWFSGSDIHMLRKIVNQAYILSRKYDCVVANPPYMGSSYFNKVLKKYIQNNYQKGKADFYASFILRNIRFCKNKRYIGMITIPNWMFLSSFERLRKNIFSNQTIDSFIHNGRGVWGSDFGSCSFVIRNHGIMGFKGVFKKLFDKKGSVINVDELGKRFFEDRNYYTSSTDFLKIPGIPISYWANDKIREIFQTSDSLKDVLKPKQGTSTGNDEKYVRYWFEVNYSRIGLGITSLKEARDSEFKYFPLNKGGNFRRWYGNNEKVIKFDDQAFNELLRMGNHLPSRDLYFKKGLTWSKITANIISVRYNDYGFVFSSVGLKGFPNDDNLLYVLSFVNSKIALMFIEIIASTFSILTTDFEKLPIIYPQSNNIKQRLSDICQECIRLSKIDWDSFETSWDFGTLLWLMKPLKEKNIKISFDNWDRNSNKKFQNLLKLEEENNQLLIKIYNLENDLTAEVTEDQITITLADRETDIKRLLSYSIGCMMGRYSLDEAGLIYAQNGNIGFDQSKYKTFPADDDGILPIMDMDWFEDDAARRFVEFIMTAWPPETLNENLEFIADVLSPKASESSEETIRRYLSTTFFKDHMKTYKKRPIYWLFSSGRQKAFECLVYLHRYNDSTLSRMRSHYVTPLQGNMRARIEFLEHEKDEATTASNQKKIQKEIDILKKKQLELKSFDDELRHYADMKISIDLDDGVKVNYGKFGNLLAETKTITGE